VDRTAIHTLLLCDVVNSTALTQELGDAETARLFAQVDRLARDLMATHGATEIDKTDGFLLLFDRPTDAIRFSMALHAALATLTEREEVSIALRVGLHLGELILRDNSAEDVARGAKPLEVDGLAKPVAARVMSLAQGGQTLLTRGAWDLAKRASVGDPTLEPLQWIAHGEFALKGLAEPIEVFEVGVTPGPKPVRSRPSQPVPATRRRWLAPLSFLVLVAVAGLASWAVATQFELPERMTTAYYDDVMWTRAGLVGVGVARTGPPPWGGYEIQSVGGRSVRIAGVNGRGGPAPPYGYDRMYTPLGVYMTQNEEENGDEGMYIFEHFDQGRPPSWLEASYDDDGLPVLLVERDSYGTVVRQSRIEVQDDTLRVTHHDAAGRRTGLRGFYRVLTGRIATLDGRGWVSSEQYVDASDLPDRVEGAHGDRWRRDELGRVLEQEHLDALGAPMAVNGRLAVTFTYDPSLGAMPATIRGVGVGGTGAKLVTGCDEQRQLRTPDGLRASCYDAEEATLTFSVMGCHSVDHAFTPSDQYQMTCLDSGRKKTRTVEGWTQVRDDLNLAGALVERHYLDANGDPTVTVNGVSRVLVTWDERGALASTLLVGADGRAIQDGSRSSRLTRDPAGRIVEVTLTDERGEPVVGALGWATKRTTWTEGDQHARWEWFDDEGEPAPHMSNKVSAIRQEYDASRRVSSREFLDGYGDLVVAADTNVAKILMHHETPKIYRTTLLDASGKAAFQGRISNVQRWDSAPDLIAVYDTGGFHAMRMTHGASSEVVRAELLGADGEPVTGSEGWSAVEFDWDGDRVVEARFFGTEGEPVDSGYGWARAKATFNDDERLTSVRQWDANGLPAADHVTGCAVHEISYTRIRVTGRVCRGPTGIPVRHRRLGAPIHTYELNDNDFQIAINYLDAQANPAPNNAGVYRDEMVRDEMQRMPEMRYLGADGELIDHGVFGFARMVTEFDDLGRVVDQSYFDADGVLVVPRNHRVPGARMQVTYDARGNKTGFRTTGAGGVPGSETAPPELRFTLDEYGRELMRAAFDAEGRPTLEPQGYAERRMLRDKLGRVARVEYRGASQELVVVDGTAIQTFEYGPYGLQAIYYWKEESVAAEQPPGGFTAWVLSRNARGQVTEERWLDAEGESVAGPFGCEVLRRVFEEQSPDLIAVQCDGESVPPEQDSGPPAAPE